jgi:hypothetical protein
MESNYVLNRTVGDMLRSNQTISALGRLARRYAQVGVGVMEIRAAASFSSPGRRGVGFGKGSSVSIARSLRCCRAGLPSWFGASSCSARKPSRWALCFRSRFSIASLCTGAIAGVASLRSGLSLIRRPRLSHRSHNYVFKPTAVTCYV